MTTDDEGPCTACGDTGVTFQTERRCACQPPESTDDKLAVSQEDRQAYYRLRERECSSQPFWAQTEGALILSGEMDALPPIQAFAQARLAGKREGMESAIAAVEGERLADPQIGTSDHAYEQALTDAITTIREQKP